MLGDGEPPLEDDASENQHDREPPEVVRLLLSTRERYVSSFFSTPNEETTARLQRVRQASEFVGIFFAIDRENMGVYKKLTCTIT